MVKFARDAADGGFIADVGRAEAAGSHATEVAAEFQEDNRFAHSSGLDSSSDAAGRAAIDAEVGFDDLGGGGAQGGRTPQDE